MRVVALLLVLLAPQAAGAACGQPVSSGAKPLASDALSILRTAVGATTCERCVCDVDNSGGIAATDALITLKVAVGQAVTLSCPACAQGCEASGAPACQGACPAGLTCSESLFEPGQCDCKTACELAGAPACGGSCQGSDVPDAECESLRISAGSEDVDVCMCLPPGAILCSAASAPACGGVCQPGAVCKKSGNACACSRLPLQGTCAQASAPECGGRCAADKICQDVGGDCACVPYAGGSQSCLEAQAPMCGGACGNGDYCAIDFLGNCECLTECEVSAAPACGGGCSGQQEQCVVQTVTFKGKSLQFCGCL